MAQAKQTEPEAARQEGSRWIDARPSGEQVARWFIDNAPMHDGMDPRRYVAGVTLIPAVEKRKQKVRNQAGALVDREEYLQTFTPYIKVETRNVYYWDHVRREELVPERGRVTVPRTSVEGLYNEHLPTGYFRHAIRTPDNKAVHLLGCVYRVAAYKPDIRSGGKGRLVFEGEGTKIVPFLNDFGKPDLNAFEKAETGAAGRALGMAGMLVLPGSGVATAEDMLELASAVAAPEDAQLPPGAPAPTDLRVVAADLRQRLESEHPEKADELEAWAVEKKIDLNAISDVQLRAVVLQMERKLKEAQR